MDHAHGGHAPDTAELMSSDEEDDHCEKVCCHTAEDGSTRRWSLLHSLESDQSQDELDQLSKTFYNSRASCFAIICCIVYGATAIFVPLTLKNSVQSSPQWYPCDSNASCLYFKSISDGSLPSSLGFNHFIVVNGEEPHYHPTLWQRAQSRMYGVEPDLLNTSSVSPMCPGVAQHEMNQICMAIAMGESYTFRGVTNTTTITNTLQHLPSGYLFLASAVSWGFVRIVHDCLLLWGVSEDWTLCLNLLALACLAGMASSGFSWVTSALELFYAKLDDDCGCFFKMGGIPLTGLLLAPALVLSHFWSHCSDWLRALLWGDFLLCVKQHVSLRNVRQFANPLSSLIGPTLRSTYANKFDSEEHWAGRSLPSRFTARLGVIVVSLCIPAVLFPWFYQGSGVMFPRMWQLAVQVHDEFLSRYSIPGMPQAHWSMDITDLKLGGGVLVYWSCLRIFQAGVIIFVTALLPVDWLIFLYELFTCQCFRRKPEASDDLQTPLTKVGSTRKSIPPQKMLNEDKLKEALASLDEALKGTELEECRMDCRESLRLALTDVKARRDNPQTHEDTGPELKAWKRSDKWFMSKVEGMLLFQLRLASFFSKMPSLMVITRDLYNMHRLEERVVLAYKICPEFHIRPESFFKKEHHSDRALGEDFASLLEDQPALNEKYAVSSPVNDQMRRWAAKANSGRERRGSA